MNVAYKIACLTALLAMTPGCAADMMASADMDPTGYLETDSEFDTAQEFNPTDTDITAERNNLLAGGNGDSEPPSCNIDHATFVDLYHDDPNATAGPVLARSTVFRGFTPAQGTLRTYEFLNYYDLGHIPAAEPSLRIEGDLSQVFDSERFTLQFGISSESLETFVRKPVNLVLSVDNSASMAGTGIAVAQESCRQIAGQLTAGDTVAVTSWNAAGGIVLPPHGVTSEADPVVLDACDALGATGGTDFQKGLTRAYAQAALASTPDSRNWVMLLTDGVTSVSSMDRSLVEKSALSTLAPPIRLLGVGLGNPESFSDLAVYTLAEAGRGPYLFIDSEEEAGRQFGERFASLVDIAADEISVSVQLPPSFRMVSAYGSDDPAMLAYADHQEIAPGSTIVFHQELESCQLESVSLDDSLSIYVTWRSADSAAVESAEFSATLGDLLASESRPLTKGRAIVRYAEALKFVAQTISTIDASTFAGEAIDDLLDAQSALGNDADLEEAIDVLSHFLL